LSSVDEGFTVDDDEGFTGCHDDDDDVAGGWYDDKIAVVILVVGAWNATAMLLWPRSLSLIIGHLHGGR